MTKEHQIVNSEKCANIYLEKLQHRTIIAAKIDWSFMSPELDYKNLSYIYA